MYGIFHGRVHEVVKALLPWTTTQESDSSQAQSEPLSGRRLLAGGLVRLTTILCVRQSVCIRPPEAQCWRDIGFGVFKS